MPEHPPPEPSQRRGRGRPSSVDQDAALDAACRVIARRGLDRTRYRDIADESGVAVSTLQHTFGRLEEMLERALDRTHELDALFLTSLLSSAEASPWERIEELVGSTLETPPRIGTRTTDEPMYASCLMWVDVWRAASRGGRARARMREAYEQWWATAEAIIEDGQRDGSFTTEASSRDLAIAVNAILDGTAVNVLLRPDGDLAETRRIALLATRQLLATRASVQR